MIITVKGEWGRSINVEDGGAGSFDLSWGCPRHDGVHGYRRLQVKNDSLSAWKLLESFEIYDEIVI
jgi:hypothetical protein